MNDAIDQVLHALFCLSQTTKHVSITTLAAAAGTTSTTTAIALVALDRAGLIDADRVRLTMRGLAAAVRIEPRRVAPAPQDAMTEDFAMHTFS